MLGKCDYVGRGGGGWGVGGRVQNLNLSRVAKTVGQCVFHAVFSPKVIL